MNNPKINRILFTFIAFCLFFPVVVNGQPEEQGQENYISKNLIRGWRDKNLFEIGRIEFEGNTAYPDLVLEGAVSSRETSRSFWHKVILTYYNEFKKDEFWPNRIDSALWKALGTMRQDIGYFNQAVADADLRSLWDFYNTHGYHFVKIHYSFKSDSSKHTNVLTFHVDEGHKYLIDTIVYVFRDSIIPDAHKRINSLKFLKPGSDFDETNIQLEANTIREELQNTGYYYASYEKPTVMLDTIMKRDSVIIIFNPGKRQRIGEITYVDSTMGQRIVVKSLKEKMLDFKTGDWYSRRRIQRSRENYLTLGLFDIANIDTIRSAGSNDTTLNFRVFTQYRKQQEFWAAPFINQTPQDNFYNAGIELNFQWKNLFNAAQTFDVYSSVSFKDLSRTFEGKPPEWEYNFGVRYAQPIIFSIKNLRIGLNVGPHFSERTFNNYFKIRTVALPVKFPIIFQNRTFIKSASVDFTFERQQPRDFDAAVENALKNAKEQEDTIRVFEAIALYQNLNDSLVNDSTKWWKPTANLLGFTITGDTRNHPFSPTKGYYAFLAAESTNPLFMWIKDLSGFAKYFRIQGALYSFFKLSQTTTIGLKGRLGSIFQYYKATDYVPIDRQFFAGGASSVRGWKSRELRYSPLTMDSLGGETAYNFLQSFVGSRNLIETSVEVRYRFNRPAGWNELVASQIANIGVTFFLDGGNAFDWLIANNHTRLKLADYFNVANWGWATGLGFRYESPVGPARLDFAWPIHDPLGRKKPFSNLVFSFGLGHAF